MGSPEANRRWKEKNKDYFKQYREKNRAALIEKDRAYYEANKDSISERKKEQYLEVQEQYIDRAKKRYKRDPLKVQADNRRRWLARRDKIHKIALHYGCQNEGCQWNGDFLPSQLEFHHLQADEKEYNVSAMAGMSDKRLAAEINKCCVLCACCHVAVTVGAATYINGACSVSESLQPQEKP